MRRSPVVWAPFGRRGTPLRMQLIPAVYVRSMIRPRCADHCRRWLAASGLTYDQCARVAFARAHPVLFGGAYHVTLAGYERWLARDALLDSVDAFGAYLERRFERWTRSCGPQSGGPNVNSLRRKVARTRKTYNR